MKFKLLVLPLLLLCLQLRAQPAYQTLDPTDPIVFGGDHILYKGEKIDLSPHAIFLDGSLADTVADRYPYVFNHFQLAASALTDGTEARPMTLYMAPWVYWIDDPDDPAIRKPKSGSRTPFGMEIECEWLRFYGLNADPANVVLASNRGQTHGADGNFTMFNLKGDGLYAENVTFGNYCNVDLEFPLNPALDRKRRAEAIVQAQLVFTNADKAMARNVRFISRLNLCPFTGARRLLFDNCYFECTDDALAGTGVYLHSRFTFYSSKPFYSTSHTGAVFLDCDFDVRTIGRQYFTKADSPVTLVDCRFATVHEPLKVSWSGAPRDWVRCYQYQVTLNGRPCRVNEERPEKTVDMSGKELLNAYRIEYGGEIIYNTYNLLCGEDDWDPMDVKDKVVRSGNAAGKKYVSIPVYLQNEWNETILTEGSPARSLTVTPWRFGMYPAEAETLRWSIPAGGRHSVSIEPSSGSESCLITGINRSEEPVQALLTACTDSGLETAVELQSEPRKLPQPAFNEEPTLVFDQGIVKLRYGLELEGRPDRSQVSWYRITDRTSRDLLLVADTHAEDPVLTYKIKPGDVGHYIVVSIHPRHNRSHGGKDFWAVTSRPVRSEDCTEEKRLTTDFRDFPVVHQPRIIPGAWTVDGFKPVDTYEYDWSPYRGNNWAYSEGIDGSSGLYGLTQTRRGARILYTPVEGQYGDMSVDLTVAPAKSSGQGFGSATGQYMDILIKYDTQTLSGYGLRVIRTPKYGDAVDFILMRYENGHSFELTAPVSADTYRTNCRITVTVRGNKLRATAKTDAPGRTERPGVQAHVNLEAEISPTPFGGTGIQHTGTPGGGSTWLRLLEVAWQ